MLLHCLLIHHKQFIQRDGLDIEIINLQVFCLPVLHLRTPSLQWEGSWNSTPASLVSDMHPSSHTSLSKQRAHHTH